MCYFDSCAECGDGDACPVLKPYFEKRWEMLHKCIVPTREDVLNDIDFILSLIQKNNGMCSW